METGVRTYTCACGDSYTESILALEHSYVSKVAQEATISAEGVMEYICTRCGNSYIEPIEKLKDTLPEQGTDGEDVSSGAPAESAGTDAEDRSPQTGDPWRTWWIIMLGAAAVIIGDGVFLLASKKKKDR